MSRSMLGEHLPEVFTEVRRLRGRFAQTAPCGWDPVIATSELSVQLGHLALCLLRHRGADMSDLEDPQRPITKVGDELADVVLATLSVTVLAHTEPVLPPRRTVPGEDEAFLRLLIASGALSEATLVEHHYRHQPTGTPSPLPEAAGTVLTACETLAEQLGVNLLDEFRSMVVDADEFLDNRSDVS